MNIDELVNRPKMYDFEDGVWELVIGIAFLLSGGAFSFVAMQPKGSAEAQKYVWGAQAIWFCSMWGMTWGAKKLKERVTSPRGGYVALTEREWTPRSQEALVIGLCIGLPVIMIVLSLANWRFSEPVRAFFEKWNPTGYAVLSSGVYVWNGVRNRLSHFFWLAAFCAALAVWVWVRNDDGWFVLFWQGAALAVAGGIRLWRFVRSHPLPTETEA
jgi:hypothetical protein